MRIHFLVAATAGALVPGACAQVFIPQSGQYYLSLTTPDGGIVGSWESSGLSTPTFRGRIDEGGVHLSGDLSASVETGPYDNITSNFFPAYRLRPALHLRGTMYFNGGGTGPGHPVLNGSICGTIGFTVESPIEFPLFNAEAQVFVNPRMDIRSVATTFTLLDSTGQMLTLGSASDSISAAYVDHTSLPLLSPGAYSLAFAFAATARASDTSGHLGEGAAQFNTWIVLPSPGGVLLLGLAGALPLRPTRRAHRGA